MKQNLSEAQNGYSAEVNELIERRATVQQWLARLDEQRGRVNDRVLDKVREDYQLRLRETLDALGKHRRSVQEQMDRVTKRLAEAQTERQAAADEFEEGRLRNAIGEIDDAIWARRNAELSAVVELAAAYEAEIRTEAQRLGDLLEQLDERAPIPIATFAPAARAEPAVEVVIVDVEPVVPDDAHELREVEQETLEMEIDDRTRGRRTDAFLGEIDRALARSPAEAAVRSISAEAQPEEDTAPKPGLKCSECGYTNDLSAWFCGVCGADVG